MKFQVFNGTFHPEEQSLIHASNRGFNYGDGFFESIRVSNGKVPFANLHWKRLLRACEVLQISIPESLTAKTFRNQALMLAEKNGEKNSRIRFQGFRQGRGRYAPETSVLGWSMTSLELETSEYQLNKTGLKIGLCQSHTINPAPQSSFKSSNSVPYILGSIYAKNQGWDDCFLQDSAGYLAEATGSNFFLVKGDEVYAPDLSNGGVAGVMRNVVLQTASDVGLKPIEGLLQMDDVLEADECFLTNATRGVQWVGAVEKKRFFKKKCERIITHINQKYGLIN